MAEVRITLVRGAGSPSLDMPNDSSSLSPPQPNLPLPRELRDQVWSYLVHYKHVKASPYHLRVEKADEGDAGRCMSAAHTNRFAAAILGTNYQIRNEAYKILQQNRFVIIPWV